MNTDAFQALINLVDFDQKTVFFQNNIKKIKDEIAALQVKYNDLEVNIQDIRDLLHETQKEVDMGELEMKEYDQQLKEEKTRLDKVANQKEYASILKEIDHLEQKQHDAEEPLLLAWNKLEQAKQEHKKKEEAFEKDSAQINQEIEEKNKKIEELETQLQEHAARRDGVLKVVPAEWVEKYGVLGERVADPVVSVEGGSCSACFYDIPPQRIIEMKKGKLVQCNGCHRFLYIKAKEE